MGRHDQRVKPSLMICLKCKAGDCTRCLDVTRAKFTDETICQCTRLRHKEMTAKAISGD